MKKYVVFKIKDWEDFLNCRPFPDDGIDTIAASEVQDAEVIRHQDITAAPIFSAYAHMIISFRDLLKVNGINARQAALLTNIADHFHQASVLAENLPFKRLPD